MKREDVFIYAEKRYGTKPDYPWSRTPESAILRHENSRKWYAAIITPAWRQLGIEADGCVDVLNLKCDPIEIGTLRMQKGIFPGYHMNKDHWISVLLDGTVAGGQICNLIDSSYEITLRK